MLFQTHYYIITTNKSSQFSPFKHHQILALHMRNKHVKKIQLWAIFRIEIRVSQTTDISGQIILCQGGGKGWPVHCRMLSSIPSLYPLNASSNSQMSSQAKKPPNNTHGVKRSATGLQNYLQLRTTDLEQQSSTEWKFHNGSWSLNSLVMHNF